MSKREMRKNDTAPLNAYRCIARRFKPPKNCLVSAVAASCFISRAFADVYKTEGGQACPGDELILTEEDCAAAYVEGLANGTIASVYSLGETYNDLSGESVPGCGYGTDGSSYFVKFNSNFNTENTSDTAGGVCRQRVEGEAYLSAGDTACSLEDAITTEVDCQQALNEITTSFLNWHSANNFPEHLPNCFLDQNGLQVYFNNNASPNNLNGTNISNICRVGGTPESTYSYYLQEADSSCSDEDMIVDQVACQTALTEIGELLSYNWASTVDDTQFMPGCYWGTDNNVRFNFNLDATNLHGSTYGGVCRTDQSSRTDEEPSTSSVYLEDDSSCSDEDMILYEEDCLAAFNEINIADSNYLEAISDSTKIPGCNYYESNFKFNSDFAAINTDTSGNIKGGLCRVGGSPAVYQKALDQHCSEEDLITTEEDCEAAFNELALDGYNFGATVDEPTWIPGCRYHEANQNVAFNTDLTATYATDTFLGQAGICRYGGTDNSCSSDSDCSTESSCRTSSYYREEQLYETCTPSGQITDEDRCAVAATSLGLTWIQVETNADRHYGCFSHSTNVYFNTDVDGVDDGIHYAVCSQKTCVENGTVYQEADTLPCSDEDMILYEEDCEAAFNEINIAGSIYQDAVSNPVAHPGCKYYGSNFKFNSDFAAINTDTWNVTGGLCRVGGSPTVYFKALSTRCTDEDMITTEADCQAAFDELALDEDGYSFQGSAEQAAFIPGCRYNTSNLIVKFNPNLNAQNTEANQGGLCRVGGTSVFVYQTDPNTSCPEADMITYEEDCEAAFNEINLDGYSYSAATTNNEVIPGCKYDSNSNEIRFNANLNAINTDSAAGGICRAGGSPAVYQKASDTPCQDKDLITTAEDCEAAFNELALSGDYTYEDLGENSDYLPGCRYNPVQFRIVFNPDLAAVYEGGENQGGVCRSGGTIISCSDDSACRYGYYCNSENTCSLSAYLEQGGAACPDGEMITYEEDCLAAFDQLDLADVAYGDQIDSSSSIPGCQYTGNGDTIQFNSELSAVHGGDTSIGGVCRIGGSPDYYIKAIDTPCTSEDMITQDRDCEAAFNALSLLSFDGYTYDDIVNNSNQIPGCRYLTENQNIKFNSDLTAVYGANNSGGVCRVGGTPRFYQEQVGTACSDEDAITYARDCEFAFDELLLDGYSWGGQVELSDKITGCVWEPDEYALSIYFNTVGEETSNNMGSICRYGGSPEVYQEYLAIPCSDSDMITNEEDCEMAFNELALDGFTWNGELTESDRIAGCKWNNYQSRISFNPDLTAVNEIDRQGGVCRIGGSPNLFQKAAGETCYSENLITTQNDCQNVFTRLNLEGYSWSSTEYNNSNWIPGCLWLSDTEEVAFNADLAAVVDADFTNMGSICRLGGTLADGTAYMDEPSFQCADQDRITCLDDCQNAFNEITPTGYQYKGSVDTADVHVGCYWIVGDSFEHVWFNTNQSGENTLGNNSGGVCRVGGTCDLENSTSSTDPLVITSQTASLYILPVEYSQSTDWLSRCGTPTKNSSNLPEIFELTGGHTIEFQVTSENNMDVGTSEEIQIDCTNCCTAAMSFYVSVQISCTDTTWESITQTDISVEIGTSSNFSFSSANTTPGCTQADLAYSEPITGLTANSGTNVYLTEVDSFCPEGDEITSAEDCEAAGNEFTESALNWAGEHSWDMWQPNCFWRNDDNRLFYNTNSAGVNQSIIFNSSSGSVIPSEVSVGVCRGTNIYKNLDILSTAASDVQNSPHTITITQSATDQYGNVITPVDTDVTLNVQISDFTCDLVEAEDIDFTDDPIVVTLFETATVSIPKSFMTTPTAFQAELCGYVSHEYSTSYTQQDGTVITLTTANGLPDFVTLDQTDPEADILTFAPQNVENWQQFAQARSAQVTVTRTSTYGDYNLVIETQEAKVTSQTFTFEIGRYDSCSYLEYSDPGEINAPEPFTPDTSVSYDFGYGLQNIDQNGIFWDIMFDPAQITYTGLQDDFMTVSDDGLYTLSFNPTLSSHYGTWPIEVVQTHAENRATQTPTKTTSIDVRITLKVETSLSLDEQIVANPIEFVLNESNAIEIPYEVTTQELYLEQERTYQIHVDGELFSGEWITVDEDLEIINVNPSNESLVGSHTIDVILTARYTDTEVIPYLEDLSGQLVDDTITLTSSFEILVLLPLEDEIQVEIELQGPYFAEPLLDQYKVLSKYWEFIIPEVTDPLNDEVLVSFAVTPDYNFILHSQNEENLNLKSIFIEADSLFEQLGHFEIFFTLTSVSDNRITQLTMDLYVIEALVETEEADQEESLEDFNISTIEDSSENDQDQTLETSDIYVPSQNQNSIDQQPESVLIPKAKFSSIDSSGRFQMSFNMNMDFPEDFMESIKNQNAPNNEQNKSRRLQQNQFNMNEILSLEVKNEHQPSRNVELDWRMIDISSTTIDFQILFEEPLEISMKKDKDKLHIVLKDKNIFRSASEQVQVQVDQINTYLPPQIPLDSKIMESFQTAGNTATMATAASGAIQVTQSFLFTASMQMIYGLINMMQMYVHYPLFDVVFPGNIFSVMKIFIGIAQLDLLTGDSLWEETFNYRPIHGMEEYNSRFSLLSYETQSTIYNLGDVSLFQFWIFFKCFYYLFLQLIVSEKLCKISQKRKAKYKSKMRNEKLSIAYNWPIRFVLETYIEMAVVSFIRLKGGLFYTDSLADFFDTFLGVLYLFLVCAGPLFSIVFFSWNKEKLQLVKSQYTKFASFFDKIKMRRYWTLHYHTFFMLRRLVFVLSCIYLDGHLFIFQLVIALLDQITYIYYLLTWQPNESNGDNWLECFTSVCIITFLYTLLTFTDFNGNNQMKFNCGYASISVFFVNLIVNFCFVLRSQYQDLKKSYFKTKQKWPKTKRKIMNCFRCKSKEPEEQVQQVQSAQKYKVKVQAKEVFSSSLESEESQSESQESQPSSPIKFNVEPPPGGLFSIQLLDGENQIDVNTQIEPVFKRKVEPQSDAFDTFFKAPDSNLQSEKSQRQCSSESDSENNQIVPEEVKITSRIDQTNQDKQVYNQISSMLQGFSPLLQNQACQDQKKSQNYNNQSQEQNLLEIKLQICESSLSQSSHSDQKESHLLDKDIQQPSLNVLEQKEQEIEQSLLYSEQSIPESIYESDLNYSEPAQEVSEHLELSRSSQQDDIEAKYQSQISEIIEESIHIKIQESQESFMQEEQVQKIQPKPIELNKRHYKVPDNAVFKAQPSIVKTTIQPLVAKVSVEKTKEPSSFYTQATIDFFEKQRKMQEKILQDSKKSEKTEALKQKRFLIPELSREQKLRQKQWKHRKPQGYQYKDKYTRDHFKAQEDLRKEQEAKGPKEERKNIQRII